MSLLDNVRSLKTQVYSMRPASSESKNFFATLPGMLAALAALITASVSLFNSCNTANKAVLERVDKYEQVCVSSVKTEREAREKAVNELISANQSLKNDNLHTRELAFEHYRKLEQRVLDLEPAGRKNKKKY